MQLDTSKSMIRTVKRICGSYYALGALLAISIMSACVVENRVIEGPYTEFGIRVLIVTKLQTNSPGDFCVAFIERELEHNREKNV